MLFTIKGVQIDLNREVLIGKGREYTAETYGEDVAKIIFGAKSKKEIKDNEVVEGDIKVVEQ